jgi:hypothetical protein
MTTSPLSLLKDPTLLKTEAWSTASGSAAAAALP